ncbi:hypothetical protein F6W96_20870 [Nocardia terpenica]|uniref:Uncharacterized protein n=1 Tax=Nocardia terpenica TaxID=455432 RepID=A0A6G9Z5V1_9NOCA|nr:hypothetical protein F6W96_20870 [Nocardia terpenica]
MKAPPSTSGAGDDDNVFRPATPGPHSVHGPYGKDIHFADFNAHAYGLVDQRGTDAAGCLRGRGDQMLSVARDHPDRVMAGVGLSEARLGVGITVSYVLRIGIGGGAVNAEERLLDYPKRTTAELRETRERLAQVRRRPWTLGISVGRCIVRSRHADRYSYLRHRRGHRWSETWRGAGGAGVRLAVSGRALAHPCQSRDALPRW